MPEQKWVVAAALVLLFAALSFVLFRLIRRGNGKADDMDGMEGHEF